jgi:Alr-MurF fusion protein
MQKSFTGPPSNEHMRPTKYNPVTIAHITGGSIVNPVDMEVMHLLTDSRTLLTAAGSLFFAIKGPRQDGHHYIQELYKLGVKMFVVEHSFANLEQYPGAVFIQHKCPLEALQALTTYHREQYTYPVVGITGSNGKTIVKEWLFQLMHQDKQITRSPRSYNSQVGVPLSVWQMAPQHEMALIEAGISLPGEMEKLERIIRPSYGIFTCIGEAHQENFEDLPSKAREKILLFSRSQTLLFCKDQQITNQAIHDHLLQVNPGIRLVDWSAGPDAVLSRVRAMVTGSITQVQGQYQNQSIGMSIPFTDQGSIENAIHCWLFLLDQGYAPGRCEELLQNLVPVAMRLELKKGMKKCTLINDTYNSDTGSLEIALNLLAQQQQNQHKTLILSDIQQTGKNDEQLYRDISRMIHQKNINRFIGVGNILRSRAEFFDSSAEFFETTQDLLKAIPTMRFEDEAILIKGSRVFGFERISDALEEKTHETVLEINLDALTRNYQYFKSRVEPSTKIMVMVKAFGYGSGTHEIASLLQFHRADYLAVAFADEGVELRESGIHMPIVVMNPEPPGHDLMIRYHLEPEIFSFRTLEQFIHSLRKAGETSYPVHIKLDTGMHRLGFMAGEIPLLLDKLAQAPEIRVQSLFSHLAASDEPVHDGFTRLQIDRFEQSTKEIIGGLNYPILRHLLNSAGIERFPDAQFEMVRLGIGLYGISSTNEGNLEPVSSLKSTISQIKTVPEGETVGYGRSGNPGLSRRIGVVPMGYADGLSRVLSNGKGAFWVEDKKVPIVGNICMDMCMINLDGIEAQEGDQVELFGKSHPVQELARQMGTIPYEVLTSISQRVKRIYFKE